nr:hypothetical protein [uncultured Kingella sp.]
MAYGSLKALFTVYQLNPFYCTELRFQAASINQRQPESQFLQNPNPSHPHISIRRKKP